MKIYITFVTNYKFLYNFKLAFEESIPNSRDKISESSPNSIHFQDRIRLTEIFASPHRGVKFLLLAFHKRGSISLSLSRFDHGELEIQHSLPSFCSSGPVFLAFGEGKNQGGGGWGRTICRWRNGRHGIAK